MADLILERKGSDAVALLKYAIENKYECSFWYYGVRLNDPAHPEYTKQNWRFIQPVALGKSQATGKLMLRAWQKGGVTNTIKPAWKTFLVDEIRPNTITVFDGENGVYYRPFDEPADPSAPPYNEVGDEKMEMGQPLVKIDLQAPPGPNKDQALKPKKKPTVKSTTPAVPNEPVDPTEKQFKKMPPNPKVKKGPKIDPTAPITKGFKEPIAKPEDDDAIAAQIIPTKDGNPNNPKNQPKADPTIKNEPVNPQPLPDDEDQAKKEN